LKTFIISDTHFCHTRILEYTNRPFGNVAQMNAALVENWNAVVGPSDAVIHLGDFGMWTPEVVQPILRQLNGNILLIRGNHDREETLKLFTWAPRLSMKIGPYYCCLSHRALQLLGEDLEAKYCEPMSRHEQETYDFCLCGHSHNLWLWNGRNLNMSVEQWNYTPVPLEAIELRLATNGSA